MYFFKLNVFYLSDYVTNDDDLMHMMKVEAWSTTMNTDTPLCIAPFYVLSRLPAPPTRQMLPISNNNNPTTTTEFSKIPTLNYNNLHANRGGSILAHVVQYFSALLLRHYALLSLSRIRFVMEL